MGFNKKVEWYMWAGDYRLADTEDMEYTFLPHKHSGLNVDLLLDDGGTYVRWEHPMWALIRNGYSKRVSEFIAVSVEPQPQILNGTTEIKIKQEDFEAAVKFIGDNYEIIRDIADEKTESYKWKEKLRQQYVPDVFVSEIIDGVEVIAKEIIYDGRKCYQIISPKECILWGCWGNSIRETYDNSFIIRNNKEVVVNNAKEYNRRWKILNKRYCALQKAIRRVNAMVQKEMITQKESYDILRPLRREVQELHLLHKNLKYEVFGDWLKTVLMEDRHIITAIKYALGCNLKAHFFDDAWFMEQLGVVDDKGFTTINLTQ